jgi:hypothetical protein
MNYPDKCTVGSKPQHGDTWGGVWKFNAHNLTLRPTHNHYEVDLDTIKTRNQLTEWIGHLLATKGWCQGDTIGHFVQAIHDLCHPEAGDWSKEFSVRQIVRGKYKGNTLPQDPKEKSANV